MLELLFVLNTAFLGSIAHCSGMCGGIVLAYSANLQTKSKILPHLLYNIGRVVTYSALGLLVGLIAHTLHYTALNVGIIKIIIGILMIIVGLSFANWIKIHIVLFKTTKLSNLFRSMLNGKSYKTLFFLGVLNGLLPCGFVYFFLLSALEADTLGMSVSIMFVFGIATVPVMLGLGLLANQLNNIQIIKKYIQIISAILIILYGVFTIYKGYMMLTHPMMINKAFPTHKTTKMMCH